MGVPSDTRTYIQVGDGVELPECYNFPVEDITANRSFVAQLASYVCERQVAS